jgi:hypothetical protein
MFQSTLRTCVRGVAPFLLAVLASGCVQKSESPTQNAQPAPGAKSDGPSEIELSDPKVSLREPAAKDERAIAMFEVKYRFTKGGPHGYYRCDISFPGTPNHGTKNMQGWELKAEGVIKDGIELGKPPVTSFEIYISEAPSPQGPFKKISNVVKGSM